MLVLHPDQTGALEFDFTSHPSNQKERFMLGGIQTGQASLMQNFHQRGLTPLLVLTPLFSLGEWSAKRWAVKDTSIIPICLPRIFLSALEIF